MIGTRSPSPISLEDAVHDYVTQKNTPFTTDEALPDIVDRMAAPPSDAWTAVDDELEASDCVFYDEETDHYIPRSRFFQGAQFLIAPQPEEIEASILIPGHRFMPFLARDVFPATCQLLINDEPPIQTRLVHKPILDLLIYLSFYGQHGALQYLTADQDSNNDVMRRDLNDNPEFAVTVFDMTDVYARYAVKPGDTFLCTVKNWTLGIYELEHIPNEPQMLEFRMQKWITDFESAMLQMWEEGDYPPDIYAQLSEALFIGPKSLCDRPPLHFGGFLARSKKVSISQEPTGTLLSHTEISPESLFDRAAEASMGDMTGRRESLDAILNDIGLSTTQDELEAYMRDTYARGERTFDAAMARVLSGREGTTFYDEAQIDSFEEFINELWEHIGASFNAEHDKRVAPFRSRILELLDKHTAWLRDCDRRNIPVSELPQAPSIALAQMTGILSQLLGLLNRDEDSTQREVDELANTLDLIEEHFNQSFAELEAATSAASTSNLRLLPDLPPASATVYQLKVSLKAIRPPIWRRLQVLGDTTLEQLHIIIQIAMGWQNYHLHDFQIDGIRYAPESDDDGFDFDEPESEADVRLCDVADEGDKFLYAYDYGDGWEHTIQVEKVLPEDEDSIAPLCIKGRRACPPEDCGGPWGYKNLLEVLNDPTHPDHTQWSEWVPHNFAPEELDLSTINTQLKHIFPT
jgi:hypothetical protein